MLAESSPFVEVMLRSVYWKFPSVLSKFSPNKTNRVHRKEGLLDFEEVVSFLMSCGIGKGDIVILHSSYGNLKPVTLDNRGIVERLLELVGEDGTLAAPVIRIYAEERSLSFKEQMNDGCSSKVCVYDVENTPISSGVLPITLKQHKHSVTSKHPINPLTAVGKDAVAMMEHNLDGDAPSGHGLNSCWKYCADQNAYIVYLGVDFGHHLTMQQVVSESFKTSTPTNFFTTRRFIIKDKDVERSVCVKERRRCMTKKLPERCVRKDLLKAGIFKTANIQGVSISVVRSRDLIDFYLSKRRYYPYYFFIRNK